MSQTKAQLIDPVDGTIVNADINASAAIAGTKISPDFGSQNIVTTGSFTGNDLEIDSGTLSVDASNNRVGIGTTSPSQKLEVSGNLKVSSGLALLDNDQRVQWGSSNVAFIEGNDNEKLVFGVAAERMRIDSAGRVLIGHSSDIGYGFRSQLVGTDGNTSSQAQIRFTNSASGPTFILAKSRNGTPGSKTIVNNNDNLGEIQFRGDDGVDYFGIAASIKTQLMELPVQVICQVGWCLAQLLMEQTQLRNACV